MAGKFWIKPYTVQVDDIDIGGVVYHPNYLKICERVRNQIFKDSGTSFPALWEKKLCYVMAECHLHFLRPLKLEDVFVTMKVEDMSRSGMRVRHTILDKMPTEAELTEEERPLTELQSCKFYSVSHLVMVSLETTRPCPTPPELKVAFGFQPS